MATGYTKLSGKKRDIRGYRQMYLAPDHLLLVDSTRFAQDYRKFALTDIHGIVTTAKPTAVMMRSVMFVVAALFLALAFAVDNTAGKVMLTGMAVVPFIVLIADVAKGPRCLMKLCTEVSTEILPVTRESAARDFLAKLAPAIEAAQGGPVDLNSILHQGFAPTPQPVKKAAPLSAMPLIGILSVVLFVDMALLIAGFQYRRPDYYIYFVTLVFGETILGFSALRLMRDQTEEFLARTASMLSLVLSVLDMVFGIGLFVFFVIQASEASKAGGDVNVNAMKWYQVAYLKEWTWYAVGWRALCGLATAIRFIGSRLYRPTPTPPAPPPPSAYTPPPPPSPPPMFGGESSL